MLIAVILVVVASSAVIVLSRKSSARIYDAQAASLCIGFETGDVNSTMDGDFTGSSDYLTQAAIKAGQGAFGTGFSDIESSTNDSGPQTLQIFAFGSAADAKAMAADPQASDTLRNNVSSIGGSKATLERRGNALILGENLLTAQDRYLVDSCLDKSRTASSSGQSSSSHTARAKNTQQLSEQALTDAKANVRAALPAIYAYDEDHNTYAGMTLQKLLAIDSGVKATIVRATATSFCVQSTVSGQTAFQNGPAGDLAQGSCP